jgi:hypothetical protein
MTMPTKIIPFGPAARGVALLTGSRAVYPRFALEVARSRVLTTVTSQSKEKQNEHPIH